MVIAWIGYCLLVSALLGAAAFACERALGHYRHPVRGVWVAAIAGSLLLPVAAFLVPAVVARLSPVPGGIPITTAELGGLIGGSADGVSAGGFSLEAAFGFLGSALGWLWIVSVLAFGTFLVGTYRGLRREMKGWTPGKVLESPVMMSADRGPAVVGVGRGVIVMPAWIAELEEDLLRLIFLHEQEHQRAGDHRWFALGLGSVAAMPWNPFLWWQLHRLRLAIEYDCDHRVIARGVSRRDYAEALLAVGSRLSATPLGAAAFVERRSAVERRLRRMTRPLRRLRGPRALAAGSLGALALAFACGSPLPTGFDSEAGPEAAIVADALDQSERPSFIPYDKPPVLVNRADVSDALNRAYPQDLKASGVGGRVELWLYIDETGEVANTVVKTSSGHPAFDRAALGVADGMEFTAALNRDQPTPVWVQQWITFDTPAPGAPVIVGSGESAGDPSAGGDPLIVIDGVIQTASISLEDINSRDIDHVEIIKGEVAEGRYGSRARNGAIVITTKLEAAKSDPNGGDVGPPDRVEGERGPEAGEAADGGEFQVLRLDDILETVVIPRSSAGGVREQPDESTFVETWQPTADRTEGRPAHDSESSLWSPAANRADRWDPTRWSLLGRTRIDTGDNPGMIEFQDGALVVIDGVIQSAGLDRSELDRLDIDRVEVIDGPGAVALFGSRGSRGVVNITTRAGAR